MKNQGGEVCPFLRISTIPNGYLVPKSIIIHQYTVFEGLFIMNKPIRFGISLIKQPVSRIQDIHNHLILAFAKLPNTNTTTITPAAQTKKISI